MAGWVNIDQIPRKGQDTVDFIIRLTAAKKIFIFYQPGKEVLIKPLFREGFLELV